MGWVDVVDAVTLMTPSWWLDRAVAGRAGGADSAKARGTGVLPARERGAVLADGAQVAGALGGGSAGECSGCR